MTTMFGFPSPLRLAVGSHERGSGKGCAMNVISYENGDEEITDFPACSHPALAQMVQEINDSMCQHREKVRTPIRGDQGRFIGSAVKVSTLLCPACSIKVLRLAHLTVNTSEVLVSFATENFTLVHTLLDYYLKYGVKRAPRIWPCLENWLGHCEEKDWQEIESCFPFSEFDKLEPLSEEEASWLYLAYNAVKDWKDDSASVVAAQARELALTETMNVPPLYADRVVHFCEEFLQMWWENQRLALRIFQSDESSVAHV